LQFGIFYDKENPWLILKLSSFCSSFSSLRTFLANIGAIPLVKVWQRQCMMLFSMPQRMLYKNQNIFWWIMMNSPPLTIRFGYLFMFIWWKNKIDSPFCWTYKVWLMDLLLIIWPLIIQSLVEYGGLSEGDIC